MLSIVKRTIMKMVIKGRLYEEDGSLYHHYYEESVCIERERESIAQQLKLCMKKVFGS